MENYWLSERILSELRCAHKKAEGKWLVGRSKAVFLSWSCGEFDAGAKKRNWRLGGRRICAWMWVWFCDTWEKHTAWFCRVHTCADCYTASVACIKNRSMCRKSGRWKAKKFMVECELKSNCSRQDVNINGVININTLSICVTFPEMVNAQTTVELFKKLIPLHDSKTIVHVFVDNARYYHSKLLREF